MTNGGYYYWLKYTLLPAVTDVSTTKINGRNKTVDLIDGGEINIIKTPGLTDFTLSVFLPNAYHGWATQASWATWTERTQRLAEFHPPVYYLDIFKGIMNTKLPVPLLIFRGTPDGRKTFATGGVGGDSVMVTLENYEIKESFDDGLNLRVELELKLWHDYAAQTIELEIPPPRPFEDVRPVYGAASQNRYGAPYDDPFTVDMPDHTGATHKLTGPRLPISVTMQDGESIRDVILRLYSGLAPGDDNRIMNTMIYAHNQGFWFNTSLPLAGHSLIFPGVLEIVNTMRNSFPDSNYRYMAYGLALGGG